MEFKGSVVREAVVKFPRHGLGLGPEANLGLRVSMHFKL